MRKEANGRHLRAIPTAAKPRQTIRPAVNCTLERQIARHRGHLLRQRRAKRTARRWRREPTIALLWKTNVGKTCGSLSSRHLLQQHERRRPQLITCCVHRSFTFHREVMVPASNDFRHTWRDLGVRRAIQLSRDASGESCSKVSQLVSQLN